MNRFLLIFLLLEFSAPLLFGGTDKCRQALRVYAQVKVSLDPFSGFQEIDFTNGFQARIIHGSEFGRKTVGGEILKQYLFVDLPKLYQSQLGAPPELLETIRDSSLKHMNRLTLVVIGRVSVRGDFEIIGGTGLYRSRSFAELPLASELEALNAQVNLPRTLRNENLVEIGRLAMVSLDWLTPTVKRNLFVQMQGVVKEILLNERALQPQFKLLSFTTSVHERFYRSLGVKINHLAEVALALDNTKRYIGDVDVLTLPE